MSCNHLSHSKPVVFDEFFELGLEDHVSPFLTPQAKKWARNLQFRAALLSSFLLIASFFLSYIPEAQAFSSLMLIGVYFLSGIPSLIESIEDLSRLEINIDILMTLAAFSSVLIGSPMEGGLLLVLFALSEAMEELVEAKAKGAISSLYKLTPTRAFVIEEDGTVIERAVGDIKIKTKILIKAGEVIPLDGKVISGASSVNLVHLTGESMPVTKIVGDEVPAGGQNMEGTLTLEVLRSSADSTISRIIHLVTEAQEARPKIQRWFDSISKTYAMSIISLSAIFAVSFPFLFEMPFLGYDGSIYRALAFLIAASPCALIIATPIAYLSALSNCARKGVLLKGGVILDSLATCKAIAFDKTGTLTTGELRCIGVDLIGTEFKHDSEKAIAVAATLERHAVHPIAKAILSYSENDNLPMEHFKNIAGYGLEASVEGKESFLGSTDYIEPKLSSTQKPLFKKAIENAQARGMLVAALLFDGDLFLFLFEDQIRPEMKETLEELKRNDNWRLLMLTGDHLENAKRVAKELPLDEIYADLRPEDKLRHVESIAEKLGLAMVGDGINDAPALARATVGISMGQVGSATAIEAADVVLLHDNLELLSWLMDLAKKTRTIVTQNLVIASGVILMATTPALFGFIPLWAAVILHEGGTILVGLNALRLLRR